ncbi:MAG: hypothetical protein QNJ53_21330 [Pleurocapsa sp. MO_192.B19]|nr:hypothetical protein [Pleurocapsa sp. MO_192.B19]
MSTQEETRKLMAKERQHQEHLKENMLSRAVEEVETDTTEETSEQARELIARQRQHSKHLEENMLSRAAEEIK